MKILITGGAGFIGSHLADRLVAAGHAVTCVDNLETGRRDSVPFEAEFVELDIADGIDNVVEEMRPDIVVHCAASYKDGANWTGDIRTNALGTAILTQACQRADVGRLNYFQTALCYGNAPQNQPVRIDDPIAPQSSYAISKTAGESYIAESGIDYVSFRLANIFGPRNLSGPIPTFYRRLTAGQPCTVADSRRDFLFVGDLVDLVLQAFDGGPAGHYHISTGRDFAIAELYDAVSAALGLDVEARLVPRLPDDAATILLDPSKTFETFGWRATTPLADGIRKAVEWYEANGVGETYTHLALKG